MAGQPKPCKSPKSNKRVTPLVHNVPTKMFRATAASALRQEQFMFDRQSGRSTTTTTQPSRNHQQRRSSPPMDAPQLVLYVWGDEKNSGDGPGGAALNHFTVVDVRTLDDEEIAPWLTGVPTLLSVDTKEVFEGPSASTPFVPLRKASRRRKMQPCRRKRKHAPQMPPQMMNMQPQMMNMPQPQMNRKRGRGNDVDSLPHFSGA